MKLTTTLVSAGFILIVATLLNIGQLYLMGLMLASIPLVCYWLGRHQRGGLRARRSHPDAAVEGELLSVTLELENTDRWPKSHLLVGDRLPGGLVREGGSVSPFALESLGTASATYSLRPEKRGCYTIGPLEVNVADPLGIFQFRCEVPVASSLIVYPSPVPIPALFLPGGNPYGASPLHSAEMRGEGSEFYGIREYQPGDPLRRVHWRSSARMGRLAVVEYEHDVSVDVTIVLETQRGSEVKATPDAQLPTPDGAESGVRGQGSGARAQPAAKETTLEYGVTLAASIAHQAAAQNDVVRLLAPGYSAWSEPGLRGAEALRVALDALARVQADQPDAIGTVLAGHAEFFRRDSFVVVITSVWSASLPAGVAVVTERGVKVAVLYIDPVTFSGSGENSSDMTRCQDQLAAAGAGVRIIRRGLPLGEQLA
jgi:uncharacterized protein (DUF58 family)